MYFQQSRQVVRQNRADLVLAKSALELFDYPKSDGGFSLEREAVRALNNGGVCLVSADFNGIQTAMVVFAVVLALGNGALDGGVGIHIAHFRIPFDRRTDLKSMISYIFCRRNG